MTECRNHYDLDIDGIKIEFLAVLGFYYVYFSMIVCLHNLSNSNRSVLYVIIYICLICVLIRFHDVREVHMHKKISLAYAIYRQGLPSHQINNKTLLNSIFNLSIQSTKTNYISLKSKLLSFLSFYV